ncbi:MAG: hypothetical protein ACFE0I_04435 [Elainellaceae cyanobacterium]
MATTTRIGTSFGEKPVLSANGRYVAFVSNFLEFENDTNGVGDVFLQNLETGQIFFVSTASDGTQGNGDPGSFDSLAISADGRYVVFSSNANNLVPGDTNGVPDLFRKDLTTGAIARLSVDSNGTQSPANVLNNNQYRPSISADGRYVAFQSRAPLTGVSGEGVFVRDAVASTTTLASVNSNGVPANSPSSSPSISADGRFVAFSSLASNLSPQDTGIDFDIYMRDRIEQTTTLVSVNSQGQKGDGFSVNESFLNDDALNPVMSPNGRYVVFQSTYSNLVPNDTNGYSDVFMHDLQTGTTTRISVDSNGNQANGGSEIGFPKSAVSADGRYVVFQSGASNLVPDDTNNATDVFVRDTVAGTTTRVSLNSNGEEPVGGFLGTSSFGGTISADGSKVVFVSNGANLNDTGTNTDEIYLRTLDVEPSGGGGAEPPPGPDTPDDDDGSTIINIIRGANGSEVLIGSIDGDRIIGRNGSDVIIGGAGDDILIGGGLGDILRGGSGDDVLRGGKGTDLLKGAGGNDRIIGGASADIMRGGSGDDIHRGGGGNDIARCGRGNDVGRGGRGNDTLVGAAGNDLLVGGNGDDTLIGGSGDDILIGRRGEDVLIGGGGADVFVADGKGIDTFQGFELGQDKIRLTAGLEFSSLTITQVGTSTLISTSETDVALLVNIDSSQLTSASFV